MFHVSRREFLSLGAVAVAGCVRERRLEPVRVTPQPAVAAPFRVNLGLQSYSLRNFKFDEVVAKMKEADIHFVEFSPMHFAMGMKPEELAAAQAKLAAAQIKPNAYGVCGIGKDEAGARRLLEFAAKTGIEMVSVDPAADAFDAIDKVLADYPVTLGIHNHGPGSRWTTADQMLAALKDHHPRFGVCLDTGHLARSGDDPVEAARKLGAAKRLHGFHFKDVNAQKHDVVVGKGTIDLVALFAALKETSFTGPFSLEYEMDATNPMPGIVASFAAMREALAKVA
ncbi:MAG: sugar phosphate isomerase/epimerase [Planctomycetes bacterium]|nr:sugar phosphate isomerase/epimerase [Planctomycetota bacterium]